MSTRIWMSGVFLVVILPFVNAQPRERMDDRLQTYRAEVFTRVLALTPAESQQFWPIYNEYNENRKKVKQQLRPERDLATLSDAEVEEQIKAHFEWKQRELDLEKDLYAKLRKVMPARKVARIPLAERQMRDEIVQKVKDRRQDNTPNRPMERRKRS